MAHASAATVLPGRDAGRIVVVEGELAGFAFTALGVVAARVTPLLSRRIAVSLDAVMPGR
jgi:hypothetical protein